DLLRREPVALDLQQIASYLKAKTIMVSGAGGSIGSELCRQLCQHGIGKLIILDNSENNVFLIENELRQHHLSVDIEAELCDVKDQYNLDWIFEKYHPQVVFHAAAYKHVPMMEKHPAEAIKNNVLGSKNIAEAADKYGVETFILISTDKAVNPTNVMGATKRIAELMTMEINKRSQTRYTAVRFGNVLGSRGSVIPTFKQQIEEGGPITVTHPEMTRFFMTIPEAVQLVIQAGAMSKGGEIFVLDMGEPVKILDLAQDLLKLYGYEAGKDIDIAITGIRPGEKLYEELFTAREQMAATQNERIFIGNFDKEVSTGIIEKIEGFFQSNEHVTDADTVVLLKEVLPEYHYSN
ncbi:MAG: UDP-N-acetylglucosamine 4,6-dehydratase family protein, partial [Ignavibacteriales bacterium]